MNSQNFRHHHLLQLLNTFDEKKGPLDRFLNLYFRSNRAIGSKDRAFLAETAYGMIRWKGLLDALCKDDNCSWEEKLEIYQSQSFPLSSPPSDLPPHKLCSFPKVLYNKLVDSYGEEKAFTLALHLNERAPTALRVNPAKISRDELIEKLSDRYSISKCNNSPVGILFHKKENFWVMNEFKAGLFEVQDEASQLVALEVEAKPGEQVLDYCSGSGGKTLGFAHRLEGRGQIYLHDIRSKVLLEAKKRLKRAGVQNSQIIEAKSAHLKKLKGKMDWVLADVPCTGTGTLRRNPDMKWKFTEEMLTRLVGEQRTIFEQALSYVKPGGYIVYSTCSILKEENEAQVEHLLKTYNLKLVKSPFQSIPKTGEMDGLFSAVFQRLD